MKKILASIIVILAVAVISCGPGKKIHTSSRALGTVLDTINVGLYANDPSAEKAWSAFKKTNRAISEINRSQIYNIEPTELAILDGAAISTAELNRISGLTSNAQTQISARVRTVDSTLTSAGNYVTRKALVDTTDAKTERALTDLLDEANLGLALADSNLYNGGYATRTFVESLLGSGGGMVTQRLPFIIGTTSGAPSASDSIVTHTEITGKHVDLWRNGVKQYQNFTATNTINGFRVSSSSIIVKPAWQSSEQVLVDITQPAFWSSLGFEGEESTLLTGLSGYWKLNETSGTTATDAMAVQDGTVLGGATRVSAKLSYGVHIQSSDHVVRVPYNTNISPKGSAFSVGFWVYLDSVPSATGRDAYLFEVLNTSSPYSSHEIYLPYSGVNANKIHFYTRNTSGTGYTAISTGALSAATWYNIVCVNRGDGQTMQIYVNGSDVTATSNTFSGIVYEGLSNTGFGNGYSGSTNYTPNIIDECAIWARALSGSEITEWYNSGLGKTHPFN